MSKKKPQEYTPQPRPLRVIKYPCTTQACGRGIPCDVCEQARDKPL